MSIDSILKREGIKVIGQLNKSETEKIASNISKKIVDAFPEHNIDRNGLFFSLSELNMYIAEMPDNTSKAKYFSKNNSIYFSKDMDLNDLNTLALHECLHFMQEIKDKRGKLLRLGLYNMQGRQNNGMALNEAAVQLMASVASKAPLDSVKYYNMEFSTESPDFYPLQTALLNEMIYFTGTYPLYHSTLYSNDVFKNTFIAKSNSKTYNKIEKNFDLIFEYEELLSEEVNNLAVCKNNSKNYERINSRIQTFKQIILEKTLETQNIILTSCFKNEFNLIKNLEDIKEFQYNLYNFKHLVINTENYNYYKDFYADMINQLEEKKEFIEKYGNMLTIDSLMNELSTVEEQSFGFKFFKKLFSKLKLLFEEVVREKNL